MRCASIANNHGATRSGPKTVVYPFPDVITGGYAVLSERPFGLAFSHLKMRIRVKPKHGHPGVFLSHWRMRPALKAHPNRLFALSAP